MARRKGPGRPGRYGPGGASGRRPDRTPKEGPIHDAVKRAIHEEIKGVAPAQILLHLRTAGLDTQTAQMVYGHVREQVARVKRRTMWGMLLAGAGILIVSLALIWTMATRWTGAGYGWWIAAGVCAAIGLLLVVIGQSRLRRQAAPRKEGTRKGPDQKRQT